jgi:hypothetical protein
LFVGTGNDDSERGRVHFPDLVMRQLLNFEVRNAISQQMEGLMTKIIKADYPRLKKRGPTPEMIRRFVDEVDRILHLSWPSFKGQPAFCDCCSFAVLHHLKEMIARTADIFGGSGHDAESFAFSRTEYRPTEKPHYLLRGSIALPVDGEADFPSQCSMFSFGRVGPAGLKIRFHGKVY